MSKVRLWILEDDQEIYQRLKRHFEKRNFEITILSSIAQGQEFLANYKGPSPDVVLLDNELEKPDYFGPDFGRVVQKRFPKDTPRFIIYSAVEKSTYFHKAIGLQAEAYCVKEKTSLAELRILILTLTAKKRLNQIAFTELASRKESNLLPTKLHKIFEPLISNPVVLIQRKKGEKPEIFYKNDAPPTFTELFFQCIDDLHTSHVLNIDTRLSERFSSQNTDLTNSAFIKLHQDKDEMLILGIAASNEPYSEQPDQLLACFQKYLRQSVLEIYMNQLKQQQTIQKQETELMCHTRLLETLATRYQDTATQIEQILDRIHSYRIDVPELIEDCEALKKLAQGFTHSQDTLNYIQTLKKPKMDKPFDVTQLLQNLWSEVCTDYQIDETCPVNGQITLPFGKGQVSFGFKLLLEWLVQNSNHSNNRGISCHSNQHNYIEFFTKDLHLPQNLDTDIFEPQWPAFPNPNHKGIEKSFGLFPVIKIVKNCQGDIKLKSDAQGTKLVLAFPK